MYETPEYTVTTRHVFPNITLIAVPYAANYRETHHRKAPPAQIAHNALPRTPTYKNDRSLMAGAD